MTYNAYEQFIAAAKKFPRWANTRRRPSNSNGGKVLESIIEEIARVEDAILDYKKSFFIVNYIGKEDSIIDYIYSAQVGNIEDLTTLVLKNPAFAITDDIEFFYNNKEDLEIYDKKLAFYESKMKIFSAYILTYNTKKKRS